MLVVMYEDLKKNKNEQIHRMLKFLKVDSLDDEPNDGSNASNLSATEKIPLKNFTTTFHRKHSSSEELFDPFTTAQKVHVLDMIYQTQKKLEKYHLTPVLDVSRYLKREDRELLAKFHGEDGRT